MSTDEATQRLATLTVEIERLHTAIWLAEREREEIRTELRRALHIADQPTRRSEVPGSFPSTQEIPCNR